MRSSHRTPNRNAAANAAAPAATVELPSRSPHPDQMATAPTCIGLRVNRYGPSVSK